MNFNDKKPDTWDANEWKQAFRYAVERRDYFLLHRLRIEVYENTLYIVKRGDYVVDSGECVALENAETTTTNTRFYKEELSPDDCKTNRFETIVEVENCDCLVVANKLVAQESGVCVLNMANRRNPGGGVLSGCGAQEEYLFRCSDYYRSLYQFADYAPMYGLQTAQDSYPMDRNYGGIFSPDVTVFRGGEEDGYPLLCRPWRVNMIAVAAINRPELEYIDGEERVVAHLIPAVKNKIRSVLRIARDNNQTSLVLGALGCGAFRNPPKHTAELFKAVMQEPEFCGVFKRICFAIKEDHNSRGRGNYAPFKEVFERG